MKQPGTTPVPRFRPPGTRVWIAAAGAPAAWVVHLLACYAWIGIACAAAVPTGALAAGLAGATLALAGAAAASGRVAWRMMDGGRGRRALDLAADPPAGHDGLLGTLGVLEAVVFAPLIVVETLPVLFTPICAAATRGG